MEAQAESVADLTTSRKASTGFSGRSKPRGRSAVSNGKRLHVVRPGDTAWARRFRDVLAEIISDLGGPDAGLSEGQRQIARRAATLCIACEKLEGEAAAGRDIDLDVYGQMVDRLGRAFQRLGLRRQPRDVSSSLATFIEFGTWTGAEDESEPVSGGQP